jgi:hypothetical protein
MTRTRSQCGRCMRYVSSALKSGGVSGRAAATQLLRLLVVWLHECGGAVAGLLHGAAHVPLLVDLVLGRHPESSAHVSGRTKSV